MRLEAIHTVHNFDPNEYLAKAIPADSWFMRLHLDTSVDVISVKPYFFI